MKLQQQTPYVVLEKSDFQKAEYGMVTRLLEGITDLTLTDNMIHELTPEFKEKSVNVQLKDSSTRIKLCEVRDGTMVPNMDMLKWLNIEPGQLIAIGGQLAR